MRSYRLSVEAEGDLGSIKRHLVRQGGTALARTVLQDIRSALRFLAEAPEVGHVRHDLTNEPVKFWTVYSYLIAYDPVSRPVGIVRILHGARDLRSLFDAHPPRLRED